MRISKTCCHCFRYATPERLLQRLTDLRFLSIDFLNTFLLTYRVFTDGVQVLEALKSVFFNPEHSVSPSSSCGSISDENYREESISVVNNLNVSSGMCGDNVRRISTCSGYSTGPELALSLSRQVGNIRPYAYKY